MAMRMALLAAALSGVAHGDDPSSFLGDTEAIEATSADVVDLAKQTTAGAATDVDRAVRLHDLVRDRIPYGFPTAFYRQTAEQVLRTGFGYGNTKATLFIALLRAARIPARQHFVDMNAEVLRGFGVPFEYLDHSYVEVFLGGRWVRTDSYVVDPPLFEKARARLKAESRALGYGIHARGTFRWNGRDDAFAQFLDDGTIPGFAGRDHGVYADTFEFFERGKPIFRPNLFERVLFRLFLPRFNAAIRNIRES